MVPKEKGLDVMSNPFSYQNTKQSEQKMKRWSLSLLLLLFTILTAQAQNELSIDVSYARFKGSSGEINLELYYCLYPSEWRLVPQQGDKFIGEVKVELTLYQNEKAVYSKAWKMDTHADSLEENLATQKLVDLLRFSLPVGSYQCEFYVSDLHSSTHSDSVALDILIDEFPEEQMWMSDLEICQKITRATEETIFTKNGMEVLPDPQALIDKSRPILYYYFEIYNILSGLQQDEYQELVYVGDSEGNIAEEVPAVHKKKKKTIDSSVEVGTINVSKLPSGAHYLYAVVQNQDGQELLRRSRKFYIYHPAIDSQQKQLITQKLNSQIAILPDEQVEREIEYIKYLLPKTELDRLKELLSTEAKREFLSDFWDSRNPDPSRSANEFRQVYLERARMANEQFGGFKDGWKTDMGRVFMLYGPPTDIERHPSSATERAYQEWTYEQLQGGVQFIFIDISGFRQFELVHSTYRGERTDYNWRDYLKP
ncbi:GWxTD domain-containing protein [candidate division KSB1 bacterium]|nr:GWxTD domain-containing protein [candidate division KSB1 bacterium]